MTNRPEDRLRTALGRRSLPTAPAALQARLSSITAREPVRSAPASSPFERPRLVLGLAAVLAGTILVGLVASGGDPTTTPSPAVITVVDGLPVMTVSEAIAARDAGELPGDRVAVVGFWSGISAQPSCPAPLEPVGALELYCVEWYGITERNEPMIGIEQSDTGTHIWRQAEGPLLTPWIPPDLERADLLELPTEDGALSPVPIIVLGHFDDPGAADCRAEARQRCRDRLVIDRIVQFGAEVMPTPLVPFDPPPSPQPTEVTDVQGLPVMTVSEALAAHVAGTLPDGSVAMRGFWTNYSVGHSCAAPQENPGELEIYCHDGEYGITERDEPIWMVDLRSGQVTYTAQGPHLTPWLPNDLGRIEELFALPMINGQWYPPVPIVVLGHFDDPRAKDCRPEARQLCRDRLVIDEIVQFAAEAVPTPGVTPPPTPFPSPGPAGLFEPEACAGNAVYTFVGWATQDELGIDRGIEGHIWAVISRDPVDRSGEWIDAPSGHRYRHYARVICFRPEYDPFETMSYDSIPGTEEIHWEDGLVTPGSVPVRPPGST